MINKDARSAGHELATLDAARVFLATYDEGSMSAAAASLGMSQSTVSRQIAALERRLAAPLFDRSRDGTTPTLAADQLAERIRRPLLSVLRAVASTRAETHPVRIGSSADLLDSIVVPAIAPLIAAGMRCVMEVGLPDRLAPLALAGSLDVLVLPRVPSGLSRRFRIEVLFREQFVLVAAPVWAEAVARGASSREERVRLSVPCLALASPPPFARRWWRQVAAADPPVASLILPDARALREAAVHGAGAVVLPHFLVADALDRGDLVELIHTEPPVENNISLVSTRQSSPETQTVVAALQDMDPPPGWPSAHL